jgi:hypothetical protein
MRIVPLETRFSSLCPQTPPLEFWGPERSSRKTDSPPIANIGRKGTGVFGMSSIIVTK